jgi:hypothetical protein
MKQQGLFKAILFAGLVAGTLDGLAAMIVYQAMPMPLFGRIASAAVGRDTFSGEVMMVLGILFHYFIAFSWTALFFLIYPKIPLLAKMKILGGIIYGAIVWCVMNLAVVPMTKLNPAVFTTVGVLKGMVILMIMIGLPVSLLANRYYTQRSGRGVVANS